MVKCSGAEVERPTSGGKMAGLVCALPVHVLKGPLATH